MKRGVGWPIFKRTNDSNISVSYKQNNSPPESILLLADLYLLKSLMVRELAFAQKYEPR